MKKLTLKELRKRPKSYFKIIDGVGILYNRYINSYLFDLETVGLKK